MTKKKIGLLEMVYRTQSH